MKMISNANPCIACKSPNTAKMYERNSLIFSTNVQLWMCAIKDGGGRGGETEYNLKLSVSLLQTQAMYATTPDGSSQTHCRIFM